MTRALQRQHGPAKAKGKAPAKLAPISSTKSETTSSHDAVGNRALSQAHQGHAESSAPAATDNPDIIELKSQLEVDFLRIKTALDAPVYTDAVEATVLQILIRWADETTPLRAPKPGEVLSRSSFLDALFGRLRQTTKDVGLVADHLTSYYDLLFELDRADEVRSVRDARSVLFAGEEPIRNPRFFGTGDQDFFGDLWRDVLSGQVAERIGWYFVGILEAGKGLVEGLAMLLTTDGWLKILRGFIELPNTIPILWKNKEIFWQAFLSAPPNEQARMVGRVVGEIEVFLATMGAGAEAGVGPKAAHALEVVPGRAGAAALRMSDGFAVDLGKLGNESARFSALMAKAGEAAISGDKKAKSVKDSKTGSATQPKPASKASQEAVSEPQRARTGTEVIASGKEPLRPGRSGIGEYGIDKYGTFKNRPGDKLAGHEMLQNLWLEVKGYGKRLRSAASRDNPAVGLSHEEHAMVGREQRRLGLLSRSTLKKMSVLEVIDENALAMNRAGIPNEVIETLRSESLRHAKSLGLVP